MSNPIIFLDFDGVLNSVRSTIALRGVGRHHMDPIAVNLVQRLAASANAYIVISSAWRIGNTVDELKEILGVYSTAMQARVLGKTGSSSTGRRGTEIAAWLADHPTYHNGQHVIIDDSNDMLESQIPHFVNCDMDVGFDLQDFIRAMRIIAPNHEDLRHFGLYEKPKPEPKVMVWDEAEEA